MGLGADVWAHVAVVQLGAAQLVPAWSAGDADGHGIVLAFAALNVLGVR